jgi:hypothetical protein
LDLGTLERPSVGERLEVSRWVDQRGKGTRNPTRVTTNGEYLSVADGVRETNLVAAVDAHASANAGLVLRFQDPDNYLAAVYSPKERAIYLEERKRGVASRRLATTKLADVRPEMKLTAQVSGSWAVVSIADGAHTYTSDIVPVSIVAAGGVGLLHAGDGSTQSFANFSLWRARPPASDQHLERSLHDANGTDRGRLSGGGLPLLASFGLTSWDDFGREKILLLDAYRPASLPYGRDWVLVLDATQGKALRDRGTR